MAEIIEKTLKDGSHLELHCMRFAGESAVPEWIRTLFGVPDVTAGWGRTDPAGNRGLNIFGWEQYYADVFSGASAEECTDHLYAASVDGKPAARMWFGYSNRNGSGNFGNVLTLPEYRKRGIMSAMLTALKKDLDASDALFLSCNAASHAAPAYSAVLGFKRIISPEDSAMAVVRPGAGSFQDVLERAYGNSRGASVREGRRGDRFDTDKLLYYVPELYRDRQNTANILRVWVPDYIHAFQRVTPGSSALSVVESASGFCAGYAFAARTLPGTVSVGFSLHPSFTGYLPELIRHAAASLDGEGLLICPNTPSAVIRTVLLDNGFRELKCGMYESSRK